MCQVHENLFHKMKEIYFISMFFEMFSSNKYLLATLLENKGTISLACIHEHVFAAIKKITIFCLHCQSLFHRACYFVCLF